MKRFVHLLTLAVLLPLIAPAASLEDVHGKAHDLKTATADGSHIVLVFWQSWCSPCKKEAPVLATAAREHPDLKFFGVISGPDKAVDEAKVQNFIEKYKLPYPQLRDRDLALTKNYGVEGTPTILVLDEKLNVLYSGHRAPKDWAPFVN
jgi:cytochrome c biogenesis protein CcmG, thiol:disulfide interchange protein DsbE